jgi:hypothetical protein
MTDEKPTPRVVRRGQQPEGESAVVREDASESVIFSDTLANGRLVSVREITAGDLLYLEKALGNLGEMERSLKLASRISVGEGRITFEDLQRLKMKDLKVVTSLLSKAGDADDDEDEFPND